jgi:hypothetical protein
VVTRAGLTQREFDSEFASAEECFLATFDHGIALVVRALEQAAGTEQQPLLRVRTSLRALLSFFDREPGWARVLVSAPACAGPRALARRQRGLELLTRLLHRHSPTGDAAGGFALSRELVAELVIGGVLSVVHARIVAGEEKPLLELAPSLMSMIVLPYLGPEAASAELTTTVGPLGAAPITARNNPQKIRTTQRTILVLRAIGASPHSSNRDVAAAAGLSDEGQTSKLLQRLHRQGLIENVGLGQAHGEPNAWLLTGAGEELVDINGQKRRRRSTSGTSSPGRRLRRTCQGGPA